MNQLYVLHMLIPFNYFHLKWINQHFMRVRIARALSQTGQPSFNFLKRGGEALAIAIIAFQPLRTHSSEREVLPFLVDILLKKDVSSVQIEIALRWESAC